MAKKICGDGKSRVATDFYPSLAQSFFQLGRRRKSRHAAGFNLNGFTRSRIPALTRLPLTDKKTAKTDNLNPLTFSER
jgi:hypothetical protein